MHRIKKYYTAKIICSLVLLAVIPLLHPMTTYANNTSFTIAPTKEVEQKTGYYFSNVKGNETLEYSFILTNRKSTKLDLKVYPADALPTQNGGRSFSNKEDSLQSVGSWISPSGVQDITLKPNEKRELKFKVKVPTNLADGQYVGVVAAELLTKDAHDENSNGATLAIDVLNRSGIQIVLEKNKENASHEMSIDTLLHDYISTGSSRLTIKLSNIGSILERPSGLIIVKNKEGEEIFKQDYQADSIYAHTTADMVYHIQDCVLPPNEYSVYYEASFSGKTISKTFSFIVSEQEAKSSQDNLEYSGQLIKGKSFWDWLSENTWGAVLILTIIVFILAFVFLLFIIIFKRKKEKENENHSDQITEGQLDHKD